MNETIPWGAIVTGATALLAVLLTNLFNNAKFYRQLTHERASRHEDILRARTEEVYVLLKRYKTLLDTCNIGFIHAMQGRIDYNQALDMQIGESKNAPDFHRIQMLIDIYFPEHQKTFETLLEVRHGPNEVRDRFKAAFLRSESGKPFIKPMMEALDVTDAACNLLISDVVATARNALRLSVGKSE